MAGVERQAGLMVGGDDRGEVDLQGGGDEAFGRGGQNRQRRVRMKKYRVTLSAGKRRHLEELLSRGKTDVRKLKHAQVLLKVNEVYSDSPQALKPHKASFYKF